MPGAKQVPPALQGHGQQLISLVEVAKPLIQAAERVIERGLDHRLAVQAPRLLHAAIDQRDDPQIIRGAASVSPASKSCSMNSWICSVLAACATASTLAASRRTV